MAVRLRGIARELGMLNALLYSIDRALKRSLPGFRVFRYHLVAQPVRDTSSVPSSRGRSIAIREILRGDPALAATSLTGDVLDHRYGQGAVCLGAFQNEALVGYIWLCLHAYAEDEVCCRFVPIPKGQAAWDFDVYVRPECRSGVAFVRLWDGAMSFLRERGIRWSMSRISTFNPHSLASHRRLGARHVGSTTFVRLGKWQVMIANIPPFLHVSSRPDRAPQLSIGIPKP